MMGLHEIKKINKAAQEAHDKGEKFSPKGSNVEMSLPKHGPYAEHDPIECGCTYRGAGWWSCGHCDQE
ncbi:MAG TPA: hypothetical protein ENH82_19390 [bacterium]|nr:hypothetical protein [bacterium]